MNIIKLPVGILLQVHVEHSSFVAAVALYDSIAFGGGTNSGRRKSKLINLATNYIIMYLFIDHYILGDRTIHS